ncbi:hypothetical protein GGP63_003301, partial [Salinibacter ruber]|nr:hypothetical protein [Salinibacter ruber]
MNVGVVGVLVDNAHSLSPREFLLQPLFSVFLSRPRLYLFFVAEDHPVVRPCLTCAVPMAGPFLHLHLLCPGPKPDSHLFPRLRGLDVFRCIVI